VNAALCGDNEARSIRTLAASAAQKGRKACGSGFSGHFRAVQGFRYFGAKMTVSKGTRGSVTEPGRLATNSVLVASQRGSRMEQTDLFFDDRFLDTYAGSIITDPATAIVELVANSWDAYATEVRITWPDKDAGREFRIKDNGHGMTAPEFERIWRTLSYNRLANQGKTTAPPPELPTAKPRSVFGRHGKGRFACFCFAPQYHLSSRKGGKEIGYIVSRDPQHPLKIDEGSYEGSKSGHGTTIRGIGLHDYFRFSVEEARAVVSTRFLTEPAFSVFIDEKQVRFEDIPRESLSEANVEIEGLGSVRILHIDSKRADRTTKQHGIAWWVNGRAVGECGWRTSDYQRILDGRSTEAKRFTFIVQADVLADAVNDDWSWFKDDHPAWNIVQARVQDQIREIIDRTTQQEREGTRRSVLQRISGTVQFLPTLGKDRVNAFVTEVVNNCPSLGEGEIAQLSGILAKLEKAQSRYGLLEVLHDQSVGDLDGLHELLTKWTVGMAKLVLDEIETRLKLINELKIKIRIFGIDEVHQLQPLFEKGLWVFGAEFETIEFTSNKGMTTVIQYLFGAEKTVKASLNRPDFVILPDSSVGFYARPAFDDDHNEVGYEQVVILDLKSPGIRLGSQEKEQVWKYVKELKSKGYIQSTTKVNGFVLGSDFEEGEQAERKEGDFVRIRLLHYDTILLRAEKRMLNLMDKVKTAPFLVQQEVKIGESLANDAPAQQELTV
jgi:hypothetical protein